MDPSDQHDNPYDLLAENLDDQHRWAFGTGFVDPLEGVDTSVPDDVDGPTLATYSLMLGDDALVYSHRLQQWITRMPELEEETAIANVALDLLGQARMFLTRAVKADPSLAAASPVPGEDHLAFFREAHEFRNVRLVERADGDFAELVGRLLVMSASRLAVFERLRWSRDPVLAAIAARAVNELAYHRDYAARWVVTLGDGTDLSRRRMQAALAEIWPYVDELFTTHPVERTLGDAAVESESARKSFDAVLDTVLSGAGLERPPSAPLGLINGRAGRDGTHTEAFGFLLAELQSVARAHPEATW
jgi:ring-1,2-phenylacetyl-CoA epoxidase subunit PaaC